MMGTITDSGHNLWRERKLQAQTRVKRSSHPSFWMTTILHFGIKWNNNNHRNYEKAYKLMKLNSSLLNGNRVRKKSRRKFKFPRMDWKWKYNVSKSMEHNEGILWGRLTKLSTYISTPKTAHINKYCTWSPWKNKRICYLRNKKCWKKRRIKIGTKN